MTYHEPLSISDQEWDELCAHPAVRKNWRLDHTDNGDELASRVFGVKFEYNLDAVDTTELYVLTAWLDDAAGHMDSNNAALILLRDKENGGSLTPIALPFPASRYLS